MVKEIFMLSGTLITMLTGIICAYIAYRSYTKRKRGKPKSVKHYNNSHKIIECEITNDNNVTVNMKITVYPQPTKQKKTVKFNK